MSQPKKKKPLFLLGSLKLVDFLLIIAALIVFAAIYALLPKISDAWQETTSSFTVPPRLVPARSIQSTQNVSLLWSKEAYLVPGVTNAQSLFFTTGNQTFISPVLIEPEKTAFLEAIHMPTGETKWQTEIPFPTFIRSDNGQIFVLGTDWLDAAPTLNNQDFLDCDWRSKDHSLSSYDMNTGQKNWGYGYPGASIADIYFTEQRVYLRGSEQHGTRRLWIDIDKGSGFIRNKQCHNLVNDQPQNTYSGGYGASFSARDINSQDTSPSGCNENKQYCFITEGNRLHIMDGTAAQSIASIEFAGADLTSYYIDVIVQNKIIVIHLDDSDQLLGFQLP